MRKCEALLLDYCHHGCQIRHLSSLWFSGLKGSKHRTVIQVEKKKKQLSETGKSMNHIFFLFFFGLQIFLILQTAFIVSNFTAFFRLNHLSTIVLGSHRVCQKAFNNTVIRKLPSLEKTITKKPNFIKQETCSGGVSSLQNIITLVEI